MVWSPLGWGRLTGKIKRGMETQEGRTKSGGAKGAPSVVDDFLFKVFEVLEKISGEIGKSIPQIAINWLLQNKSVSNIVIGSRNEKQLRSKIAAVG